MIGGVAGSGHRNKERRVASGRDGQIGGLRRDRDIGLWADEGDLANSPTREGVVVVESLIDEVEVAIGWADRHVDESEVEPVHEVACLPCVGVDGKDSPLAEVAGEVLTSVLGRERWVVGFVERTTHDRAACKRIIREVVNVAVGKERIDEARLAWVVRVLGPFSFEPAVVAPSFKNVELFVIARTNIAKEDLARSWVLDGLPRVADSVGKYGPVDTLELAKERVVRRD